MNGVDAFVNRIRKKPKRGKKRQTNFPYTLYDAALDVIHAYYRNLSHQQADPGYMPGQDPLRKAIRKLQNAAAKLEGPIRPVGDDLSDQQELTPTDAYSLLLRGKEVMLKPHRRNASENFYDDKGRLCYVGYTLDDFPGMSDKEIIAELRSYASRQFWGK